MAKITIADDCGNSPKQQFIKEFNIAFAEEDTSLIMDMIAGDIVLENVGDQIYQGKAAVRRMLDSMPETRINHLILETVITHGKFASASGIIEMSNGECYEFCDVYQFSSATGDQIKKIKAFVIPCSDHVIK